ncbi:vacuolar protein sorting-associated protein 16 homolog isoform X2 [Porites lutea]|uniref:vacuolar protein sorting-associated protein 16 homolog isoform X2 n=1 Tax=Porites lutea TaxID=51062 RepID=UPI003CC6BD0E
MAHVTVDWNPLGKVFYRKVELYSMEWQDVVDLSRFIVSAAPFGGPMALIRDDKHFARVQGSAINKPIIHIFSSAGRELATVKWDGGPIVQMGWSITEDLLCVADDGTVMVYDIHGAIKKTLSMGQDAKESKIIDCKTYNFAGRTGIAILTSNYHFYVANNVEEVRSRRYYDPPGLDAPPSSWVIMPHDRGSSLLVAIDNLLYLTEKGQCNRLTVSFSAGAPVTSIIEMAISYNYEYLAMFTDTGLLWIGSADLQKVYCEFNTSCPSRPKQLTWCAMGAVICYWDDYLDVVGPTMDTIRYQMDSAVHLVQELDGVRIIGNETHELLQRVPAAVEQVFKIGSMEPGAMLFDASKEFEKKSARAEEYIRMIKERLPEAVQQCIHAAAGEHEPAIQRGLLRAASFGKSFLTDMPPHAFVSMCRNLRVLNAVRDYMVGIPLTYGQLEKLTMKTLIDRLVLRRHYCLAIRICDYLKIPKGEGASRILGHWACYKVQQANVDDEEIARAINSKLGETPGISYSEIASKAVDCGRTHLAIKLLDYEAKAADQVPLLMRMNKDDLALEKAIMSGDTDLVYMVVMHLKDNLTLGEFLMAIRYHPVALSLYIKYCKDQDRRTLVDLFYQDDQFMNSGNAFVQDSYNEKTIESKMNTLSKAQMSYQQGGFQFYSKATEEQMKLMEYQVKLEEKYRKTFMDLSLSDTIYQCILQGEPKVAEQLKKEFKVPDKRFYWLKVRSLAESHNWLELDKFSKARKSLIGYEPFFEACLESNNRIEAEKYVSRVLPGKYEDAAETAFAQKSEDGLDLVLGKCATSNRPLVNRIQEMKAQLRQRR